MHITIYGVPGLTRESEVVTNIDMQQLIGLPTEELTIATLLKPAGYATCAVGKWHLGVMPHFHPLDRGYDTFLGLPESIDYGCTDTAMGAPDSGCLNWTVDTCPLNTQVTGCV